jgi:subtilisin-like proprotein convertase family protein
MKRFVILVGLLLGLSSAFGQSQVTVTNSFKSINAVIPDASNIGLDDTRNVTLPGLGSITDLKVNLTVAGGFNGDLYCYLRHESGFVVLLNRPGRSAANDLGSEQPGMKVSFSQDAFRDIHTCQNSCPLNAAVAGEWAPDGRQADPRQCLQNSPRNSSLASFAGLNPNGKWTLFLADMNPGSQATLVEWSLVITATPRSFEHWPNHLPITLAAITPR